MTSENLTAWLKQASLARKRFIAKFLKNNWIWLKAKNYWMNQMRRKELKELSKREYQQKD